jgi:hypothetical protein
MRGACSPDSRRIVRVLEKERLRDASCATASALSLDLPNRNIGRSGSAASPQGSQSNVAWPMVPGMSSTPISCTMFVPSGFITNSPV